MFNSVRNCRTVLDSRCTVLPSHKDPVALHLCQHLVLPEFQFSRSHRCVVVAHCDFNFHFPNNQ